jgi:hypothetical protein
MRRHLRIVCSTILALTICFLFQAKSRADIVVDFGSGGFQFLPYSEDGFTFTNLSGGAIVSGGPADRRLTVNNPFNFSVQTRITGTSAFDLLSFDLINPNFRDWRIEASSGAVFSLTSGTSTGTKTLSGPGWSNLTYVDIRHLAGEANAVIVVDNFHFNMPSTASAPEPHTFLVIPALGLIAYWRRRRVMASKS